MRLSMSLTKKIPAKLKQRMADDPYYQRCCVTDTSAYREKVDWHHNFETYKYGNAGRLNEAWCILPVVHWVHAMADRADVRELLDWHMLTRAHDKTLEHWSNHPGELIERRNQLNIKYADQKNHPLLQHRPGGNLATIDF